MAISQELVSIKSAGTYRREFDLSTMQPTYESTYSRGRIVPGFSYKGPFNKPIKITDSDQFVSIFGNIDPKLEANGCYFHRTCLDMLKAGPIIALNLHSYEDNSKIIDGCALGTSYVHTFKTSIKQAFSTSLWYEAWPERLKDSMDDIVIIDRNQLCDFHSSIRNGLLNWGNLSNTSIEYHNVVSFSEDITTSCKNKYYVEGETPIGRICLMRYIPDSNNDYVKDEDFANVDILLYDSSVYSSPSTIYKTDVQEIPSLTSVRVDSTNKTIEVTYENPIAQEIEIMTINTSLLQNSVIGNILCSDPHDPNLELVAQNSFQGTPFVFLANGSGNDIRAYVYKTPIDTSSMLAYNIPISDYYGGNIPYELQEYLDANGYDPAIYTLADFMFTLVIFNDVKTLSNDMIALKDKWGLGAHNGSLKYIREDDALFDCNGMSGIYICTGASVPGLTNAAGVDISIDSYLRSIAPSTNIIGYTIPYCEKATPANKRILETTHLDKIPCGVEPYINNPENYKAILHSLRDPEETPIKYEITKRNPKSGQFDPIYKQAPKVYGVTNMWKAIIDRMVVSFRYLVDCWGYGIEPESKSIFAKICMAQHATGLLNAPSAKDISKVDEFVDDFGSIVYKNLASSSTFSAPNIKDGATHVGYFYPFNKKKSKLLPPAGVVSNLFIQKENPWDVVAGVLRGALDDYNPEVPVSTKDREWLEAMGINAIIDVGDDQGTICVYGNKTSKQKPVSALSALNFRDFVVYIMDEIENIIRPYVFSENTEAVRTEIVSKCTTFLKSITATPNRSGGLTAFEVIMNSTNNSPEVIDNFYGVLDIKIEGARPMEKVVQRLYILPTGTLTSNNE